MSSNVSNSARKALDSIASKNVAKESFIFHQEHASTLSASMNLRDDIRSQRQLKRDLIEKFVDHCDGDKGVADMRIKRVREQTMDDDDEYEPDSQETIIHDMINLDYDTHNMAKHHKILSIKLDSFLESKDD